MAFNYHPRTKVKIGNRKPSQKVACQTSAGCPKGNPEIAHEKELNARNRRLMQVYRASKVGIPVPYSDPVARFVLGYLHQLMERHEDEVSEVRMMRSMLSGRLPNRRKT